MDEKALLIANVTKAHNLTDTEVTALLYDADADGKTFTLKPNADSILYDLEAKRVNYWKQKVTETSTKVANEKTAQINSAWENRLKTELNIADDLKGEDLLTKAVEMFKTQPAGSGKGKNSPEYIELEMKANKTAKDYADLQAMLQNDYVPKSELQRQVRLYDNNNYADQLIAQYKFIPDDDKLREQTKRNYFKQELQKRIDDVQIIDGKRVAFKDGKRVENELGHPVIYDEIVKEVGLLFWPIEKQGAKGNGQGNAIPGSSGVGTGRLAEIQAKLNDPSLTPQEKFALMKEAEALRLA